MEYLLAPGSFIWRWISDEWLLSRGASLWFGLCSLIIVWMSVVILIDVTPGGTGTQTALGVGGVLAAFSVFFLWGGMWRYWAINGTTSSARRAWFCVLVFCLWYGAIFYYSFVYLPGRRSIDLRRGRSGK